MTRKVDKTYINRISKINGLNYLKKVRLIENWKGGSLLTYHSVSNSSIKEIAAIIRKYNNYGITFFTTGGKKSVWPNHSAFYFVSKGHLLIIKWPKFDVVTAELLEKFPPITASLAGSYINNFNINKPQSIDQLILQLKTGPKLLFLVVKQQLLKLSLAFIKVLFPLYYLVIWHLQKQLTKHQVIIKSPDKKQE